MYMLYIVFQSSTTFSINCHLFEISVNEELPYKSKRYLEFSFITTSFDKSLYNCHKHTDNNILRTHRLHQEYMCIVMKYLQCLKENLGCVWEINWQSIYAESWMKSPTQTPLSGWHGNTITRQECEMYNITRRSYLY